MNKKSITALRILFTEPKKKYYLENTIQTHAGIIKKVLEVFLLHLYP